MEKQILRKYLSPFFRFYTKSNIVPANQKGIRRIIVTEPNFLAMSSRIINKFSWGYNKEFAQIRGGHISFCGDYLLCYRHATNSICSIKEIRISVCGLLY